MEALPAGGAVEVVLEEVDVAGGGVPVEGVEVAGFSVEVGFEFADEPCLSVGDWFGLAPAADVAVGVVAGLLGSSWAFGFCGPAVVLLGHWSVLSAQAARRCRWSSVSVRSFFFLAFFLRA